MQAVTVFNNINRLIQGRGCLSTLASEVQRLGAKKVLIVTDPGLMQTGIPGRVANLLVNFEAVIYSDIESDPSVESVDACAIFVKEHAFDLIIGLGGGSSIDTAKCVSIIATNGGKTQDYLGIEKMLCESSKALYHHVRAHLPTIIEDRLLADQLHDLTKSLKENLNTLPS